jgi:hypothetical protein
LTRRNQFIGGAAAGLGGAQIERAAQLQAVALGTPGEPQLIVLPVAGQGEGQVAVVRAVERQVFGIQDMFDYVQRIVGNVDFLWPHGVHQISPISKRA